MEQDDAMDWGLWMPIICGLAAGAACCSLTVVFYCWCAMRDQFSSLSSLSTSSNFNFRGAFEQSRGPLQESQISPARAYAGPARAYARIDNTAFCVLACQHAGGRVLGVDPDQRRRV